SRISIRSTARPTSSPGTRSDEAASMRYGILSFGAYIPRLRLARKAIADANGWFNAALKAQGKGERAICNWDEDPITMAVEAGRDALLGQDRAALRGLRFASTSFPFLDRLNAGL